MKTQQYPVCICDKIIGWPFCAASLAGIGMVFRNVVRAAALQMVSGYLEVIGKIAIASITTGFMLIVVNYVEGDDISSLFFPALVFIHLLISVFFCFVLCFCKK